MKRVLFAVIAACALCGCASLPEGWKIQIIPPVVPAPVPVVQREYITQQVQPMTYAVPAQKTYQLLEK